MASRQSQLPYSIPTPVKNTSCQELLISNAVIISGFLRKMPSARKRRLFGIPRKTNWKSRYVIIANGCVYLFKDESSDGYRRAMSLFGFKDVRHEPLPAHKRMRWVFKVVDALEDKERERSLCFAARSKESMNQWMERFKEEITKACMGHFRPFVNPFPRLSSSSSDVFDDRCCGGASNSLSAISPQVTDRQWNMMKEKSPGSLDSTNSSSSDDEYTEIIDDGDDDEEPHGSLDETQMHHSLKLKDKTLHCKIDPPKQSGCHSPFRWSTPNQNAFDFTPTKVEKIFADRERPGSRVPNPDLRYPPTVIPRPKTGSYDGVKKKPPPPLPVKAKNSSTGDLVPSGTVNRPPPELPNSLNPSPIVPRRSNRSSVDTDESDEFKVDHLVKSSFWSGCKDEAEVIMDGIKEEGVFMIRNATDDQDYKTLLVRSNLKTRKYKINKTKEFEEEVYSLHLGKKSFPTVRELLEFYINNSVPNDTVKLSKPFSEA